MTIDRLIFLSFSLGRYLALAAMLIAAANMVLAGVTREMVLGFNLAGMYLVTALAYVQHNPETPRP